MQVSLRSIVHAITLLMIMSLSLLHIKQSYAAPLRGIYLGLDGGFTMVSPYEIDIKVDAVDDHGNPFLNLNRIYSIGDGVGYAMLGSIGEALPGNFSIDAEMGFRRFSQLITSNDNATITTDILSVMINAGYRFEIIGGFSIYGSLGLGPIFSASQGECQSMLIINGVQATTRTAYFNALDTFAGAQLKVGLAYQLGAFGDVGVTFTMLSALPVTPVHDMGSWSVVYDSNNNTLIGSIDIKNPNPVSMSGVKVVQGSITASTRLFFAS